MEMYVFVLQVKLSVGSKLPGKLNLLHSKYPFLVNT